MHHERATEFYESRLRTGHLAMIFIPYI